MALSFDQHRQYVADLVLRTDQAIRRADPEAPVPGCEGWDANELRDHCAGVLAFWIEQLRVADPTAGKQFGPEVRDRYKLPLSELGAEIRAALTGADPDQPCWNWTGENQTVSWAARRLANEFTVHTADAQATAKLDIRIPREMAIDGLEELLDFYLSHPTDIEFEPMGTILWDGGSDGTWTVEVGEHGVRRANRRPTAWIRGSVEDLLLSFWGRPASVNEQGDRAPITQLRALAHFP